MTWAKLSNQIKNKSLKSASWESDQKHLLMILSKIQKWEISEEYSDINISNFRTIINEARRAIKVNDRERLEELLSWASQLTVADLRLKLGTPILETITVNVDGRGNEARYRVELSKEQLELIKKKTRLNLQFKIKN